MNALPHASQELAELLRRLPVQRGAALASAQVAPQGDPSRETPPQWSFEALAGRACEISRARNTASLTAAAGLLLEAQQRKEPAAWIAADGSCFFPPDFQDVGIDLKALPVILAPDTQAAGRAATQLLRSGAFGFVVLDLPPRQSLPLPLLSRLAALAQRHHAVCLFLTHVSEKAPSLGPRISLRAAGTLRKVAFDRFSWELHVLKDTSGGPGWNHGEICRGPAGLC